MIVVVVAPVRTRVTCARHLRTRAVCDSGRGTGYMESLETQRAAVGQTTTVIVEKREA